MKQIKQRKIRHAKNRELDVGELMAIAERAKSALSAEEHDKLSSAVSTLAHLTSALETKGASIERLRRLLFGAPTEKTSKVLGQDAATTETAADGAGRTSSPSAHQPG